MGAMMGGCMLHMRTRMISLLMLLLPTSRRLDHRLHIRYPQTSPQPLRTFAYIAGATNIIRFGPGPNGMMRTLGQYMMGSAATFGCVLCCFGETKLTFLISFFMAIGTTIRTETEARAMEAFARARRRPIVLPAEYRYPHFRRHRVDEKRGVHA